MTDLRDALEAAKLPSGKAHVALDTSLSDPHGETIRIAGLPRSSGPEESKRRLGVLAEALNTALLGVYAIDAEAIARVVVRERLNQLRLLNGKVYVPTTRKPRTEVEVDEEWFLQALFPASPP